MEQQTSLERTARYMVYAIIGLALIFLLLGLLINRFLFAFEPWYAYTVGLLLGSLLSIFKVYLLQRSIRKSVEKEEQEAKNYATGQFLLRHGLTLGFLVACIFLRNYIGLFGGILGILTLQFSAYVANFLMNRQDKLEKNGTEIS